MGACKVLLVHLLAIKPSSLQQLNKVQHEHGPVLGAEEVVTRSMHNIKVMCQLVHKKSIEISVWEYNLREVGHMNVVGLQVRSDRGKIEHQLKHTYTISATFNSKQIFNVSPFVG